MSQDRDISQIRQALFGRSETAGCFYATIKKVDANKRTCVITDDNELDYEDVLLYAVENPDLKGFVTIPQADSRVLVSRIGSSNELYVAMFSEVEKVLLSIGDKVTAEITDKSLKYINDKVTLEIADNKVKLTADQIDFNGGDLGGLIKIEVLTAKVNDLVTSFNSHIHPGVIIAVAGGSGTPATGTSGSTAAPSKSASTFSKGDYENTKIKH